MIPDKSASTQGGILIVSAVTDSVQILSDILCQAGYLVQQAQGGNAALMKVHERLPELILLDLSLPDMDGVEICRRIKGNNASRAIPVIFLASHDELGNRLPGSALEAQDYIAKPIVAAEVLARVRTQLELRSLRADMERRVRQRTIQLETAADALREEITMRRKAERALELAGKVFETSVDAIMVSDVNGAIMAINPAFTRITGYTREDVVGKSPNVLKSDRHEERFYEKKWESIKESGYWTGEVWNRRKDGNVSPMMETISVSMDKKGTITNYISVIVDISEMKDAQTLIKFLAYHDPLTGLPNRIVAREHFDEVAREANSAGEMVAVIWFDIDRFKVINDSIGHAIGDQVLKILAGEFLSKLDESDKVTRQGGDEFLLVSGSIRNKDHAASLARKLLDLVGQELMVEGHRLSISASMGIALYPDQGESLDDLLRNAENALYQAKKDGGNTYRFYTEDMSREAIRKLEMQTLLRAALANNELRIVYQPKIELESGKIVGAEALLRWNNPKLGNVSPLAFISCAEETGLIHPIGEWALNTVCDQIAEWRQQGLGDINVSVNLSAHQFLDKDLGRMVERIIHDHGISPRQIELEITESILMADINIAVLVLKALKDIGVTISLDDFGTGYSSLSYLKNLPIDTLKIDKSFVDEVHTTPNDAAIALTIIALSRNLGLNVVAEGVEKHEQYAFLQENGCDMVQGFYISKPLCAEDFEKLVRLGYSTKALRNNVA